MVEVLRRIRREERREAVAEAFGFVRLRDYAISAIGFSAMLGAWLFWWVATP